MGNPFFSVIVVSYNAQELIEKTIKSVLMQSFKDYEVIVKDGESTDETLKRVPENDKVKVYCKKDGGIYQGMNEAIDYAQGKYLCFLNCGDFFVDESVLENIYKTAIENEDAGVVLGDYSRKGVKIAQPSKITGFSLYRNALCHQTMFIKKEMFEKHGKYDTTFKMCADWNHTVTCFKAGEKFVHSDTVVCDYLGGGASETKTGSDIVVKELGRIRDEKFSKKEQKKYDFMILMSAKGLRQKMASDKAPKWVRTFYRGLVGLIYRRK